MKTQLYSFWRSSASFRVRIALNLKGIDHEIIPIHLLKNGGEQTSTQYEDKNPNRLVPLLIEGDHAIHQSLAIVLFGCVCSSSSSSNLIMRSRSSCLPSLMSSRRSSMPDSIRAFMASSLLTFTLLFVRSC